MIALIVEDDIDLNEGLQFFLESEGWQARSAKSAAEAEACLNKSVYDLVLLDCNLPDGDGFTICRNLRKFSKVPVLMLTARDGEMDEVKALELGADDYITKPFSLSVLRARIKNLMRRFGNDGHILSNGITIDREKQMAYKDGERLNLSAVEYRLLYYLLENKGQILSKDQILTFIWDHEGKFVDDNTVSVNIRRLRMKIEKDASNPEYIRTIHGLGYIWKEQ